MASRLLLAHRTTLTGGRIAALMGIGALIAAAVVAGPLAESASAAPTVIHVTDAGEFNAAIATVNGANGTDTVADDFTIVLDNDIDYTDNGGVILTGIGSDPHNVVIDGDGNAITCDDQAGSCNYLIESYMGPAASLTFLDITVSGFRGGAVYLQDSALTIDGSEFSDNAIAGDADSSTATWGGAVHARGYYHPPEDTPVTIIDSVFTDNTASAGNAYGGAVYLYFTIAEITNTVFRGNEAQALSSTSMGGAVAASSSSVTITGSTFEDNVASGGPDAGYGGALAVTDGGAVASDTEFSDNASSGSGGAVYAHSFGTATAFSANELTTFEGNDARHGGGVAAAGAQAHLSLDTVVFDGNTAVDDGGALWLQSGSGDVVASLFTNNSAEYGGALKVSHSATFALAQSTVADNTATAGGGALQAWVTATVNLTHVTLSDNSVPAGSGNAYQGGQILSNIGSSVTLFATVVVDTLGGGVACSHSSGESPSSNGFNFVDDTSCALGGEGDTEQIGADAELGPLQFNGGPTDTLVPNPLSPLVDAIEGQDCAVETEDQRGVLRYQGEACDIGAVETFEVYITTVATAGGTVRVAVLNAYWDGEDPLEVDAIAAGALNPAPPAGVALPYGALGLTIPVWAEGWPVDVYIETPSPTNSLWKLLGGTWGQYPGTQLEQNTVWAFHLVDGGDGDNDGDADSVIHDPVGPGAVASFTG